MKYYEIQVYTVENSKYTYSIESETINVPREHAKRIILEGYWEARYEKNDEIFHAPWRIVKVKIKEMY